MSPWSLQISEDEARMLGPEWPAPEVLSSLQRQVIALSYDVSQQSMAGQARCKRLSRTILHVLQVSSDLQVRLTDFQLLYHPFVRGAAPLPFA